MGTNFYIKKYMTPERKQMIMMLSHMKKTFLPNHIGNPHAQNFTAHQ